MEINLYTLLGQLMIFIIIILIILIFITLILGYYLLKRKKLVFPKILLFGLNITYPIIKYILKSLELDDLIIDRISIDLRNKLNEKKFEKINSKDVIIVLPHCLRAIDCPAKLGPTGIECINCNRCAIGVIKEIADKKEITTYIVPGSSFIKNILKIKPFKAVIGVACPIDLNKSMTALSDFKPQGVYLLKDGCINTIVNVDEVIDLINKTQPTTNYSADDATKNY